jgi:hypothetical protein
MTDGVLTAAGGGGHGAMASGGGAVKLTDVTISTGVRRRRRGDRVLHDDGRFAHRTRGPSVLCHQQQGGDQACRHGEDRAASHVLLRSDSAGTGSGNTGAGRTAFTAIGETFSGNLITGGTGTIGAALSNGTTLTATISKGALTIDSTSKWIVTANSTLTSLHDAAGISGTSIKNVIGNGHTITYDSSLAANSRLAGKTYKLASGGVLRPA